MDLAAMQELLALLYTRRPIREAFFADPVGAAKSRGLGADEAALLAQLSPAQVGFFARSLQRKRLGEVSKLLPGTRAAMGERFGSLFFRFAETYVPTGVAKHRYDTLAFARYLEEFAQPEGRELRWVLDILRYEAGWVRAFDRDCRLLVRPFHYAIGLMAASQRAAEEPVEPQRRFTIAVWWRLSPRSRLRHRVWSLPLLVGRWWPAQLGSGAH